MLVLPQFGLGSVVEYITIFRHSDNWCRKGSFTGLVVVRTFLQFIDVSTRIAVVFQTAIKQQNIVTLFILGNILIDPIYIIGIYSIFRIRMMRGFR